MSSKIEASLLEIDYFLSFAVFLSGIGCCSFLFDKIFAKIGFL